MVDTGDSPPFSVPISQNVCIQTSYRAASLGLRLYGGPQLAGGLAGGLGAENLRSPYADA